MKKLLLILLCFVIVLPCFAGCNSKLPGEDISKYTIIIPKDAGSDVKQQSRALMNYISNHTGVSLEVKTDEEVAASDKSKEILLGATNRTESSKALESVENGFVVKFTGNKVVLAGTSDAISADAAQWFIKNYVQEKSGEKYIVMDESLNVTKTYTPVKLAVAGICNYSVVYSGNLDDNNGRPTEPDVSYDNGGIDYEVQLALNIQAKLEELIGSKVPLKSDDQPASGPEILVGKTNRSAYNKVISQMGYTQYGIGYADDSIVVAGYSTASTVLASELFIKMLVANKESMTLCLGEATARSNQQWVTNFPSYDGGIMRGTSESFADELQYYITNTNEEQYRAYCSKLEANGYKLHMSNEIPEKLISNTYMSDKYVIHVYYAHATQETRLIVGALNKVTYPAAQQTTEYEKVTDVQITQLQLDFTTNSGGMGYVITLEDGSFLLIDSGSSTSATSSRNNKDHVRIWNLLNQLNKRKDGKIIIRGWFITHSHADHIDVYRKFCEEYGNKVTLENYYECVVPKSVGYNSKNPGSTSMKATVLHSGMKMEFYGVEVEVLYTVEDMYPRTLRYYNDASTVFRVSANGTVAMFLGDACDKASDILSDRYGDYLKSDIVQVAHHANIGATTQLYEYIDPTIALWPTSQKLFNQLITGEGNQRHYEVNYKLYRQMRVEENYVCSDYSVVLTIPEGGYVLGSAEKYVFSTVDEYR